MKSERTRILVVDDHSGITSVCRRLLELSGPYAVCEENSGLEAVATARRFQPALILLDLELPDCGGDEIVAAMKADPSLAVTPIVLISGTVSRARVGGYDGPTGLPVLPKPIEAAELLRFVEGALAAPSAA